MKLFVNITLLGILINCSGDKEVGIFNDREIESMKQSFEDRYMKKYDDYQFCILGKSIPFSLNGIDFYDSYFHGIKFKYFSIPSTYGYSMAAVKTNEDDLFLFTSDIVNDLIEFSNENYYKRPKVSFVDYSNHPEIIEFNRLLDSQNISQEFLIYSVFLRCFQVEGEYSLFQPIFEELTASEIDEWIDIHVGEDFEFSPGDYNYFNVGDIGLAEIQIQSGALNLRILNKVYPNDYKYLQSDIPPTYSDGCR